MKALNGLLLATLLALPAAHAQDTLTGYTGQVTLQGSVTGAGTATIRVYNNGLVAQAGKSDVTGQYSITFPLSGERDETVVVWFLSDQPGMVPEILIVKESSSARRNGVWSPCLPHVKPQDVVLYNVEFKDEQALLSSLQESDCFDEG